MIEYPPKPRPDKGQFAPEVFPAIDPIPVPLKQQDDSIRTSSVSFESQGSTTSRTLRPEVKIEFGVNKLWLEGGGKQSKSYNNGVNGAAGIGGQEGFHFAPTQETAQINIKWELHHPHHIQFATLELFCRHKAEPIWSRTWGASGKADKPISDFAPRAKNDGTYEGTLKWDGNVVLPTDLFPKSVLTVAKSPYQLKLTISAGSPEKDQYGYPLVAWTHAHILAHELKLHWGKEAAIPKERPEVLGTAEDIKDRGRDAALDELLVREKALLTELRKKAVTADQDIILKAGTFNYTQLNRDHAIELAYYRDMWGYGPMIPLCAAVTVKNLADAGVRDTDALHGLEFLWDWKDNDGSETLENRLDSWLGQKAAPANQRATRVTRHFMEKTFERFKNDDYPFHSFNCPASLGGKRGDQSPFEANQQGRVFADWDGSDPFPFEVKPAATRNWASLSSTAKKDAAALCDAPFDTAVLFEPTCIAGDRFKVAVYAMPWTVESPDQTDDPFYDLATSATQLPNAATGFYTVWRSMRATYYSSPSFHAGINGTIDQIKTQLKKELGFIVDINSQPFPNLRTAFNTQKDEFVKARTDFKQAGKALYFYSALSAPNAVDQDYAFDTLDGPDEHWDALENIFRTARLQAIQPKANLTGRAIRGGTSGALGVVLAPPAIYANLNCNIVVVLNGTFTDGENATSIADDDLADIVNLLAVQPLPAHMTVVSPASFFSSSRDIRVDAVSTTASESLHYDEGTVRATRHLTTAREQQLDNFLVDARNAYGWNGPLEFRITAKTGDSRERERVDEVKAYLRNRILDRDALFEHFIASSIKGLSTKGTVKGDLEKFQDDILRTTIRSAFNKLLIAHAKLAGENANWATDGVTIFYHLRGRAFLDFDYTTGGIENVYCTEKFGISGLTVPAVHANQRVEKRWLKDPVVVAVHEFGHSLHLKHSMPRFFDSKDAPAATKDHLYHDTCIMNYDADSSSFCAVCQLRKRGWKIEQGALYTADLGAELGNWPKKCMELMQEDVDNAGNSPTPHIRLAMFKWAGDQYLQDGVDRTDQVKALLRQAEQIVPTNPADNERRVWLLRNQVVLERKLVAKGALKQSALDDRVKKLKKTSEFPLDLDVITAANLGRWRNSP